ncbi:MAG: hypothetical protein CMP69_01005 [Flavobacteriales bacterium]|nr:hypothetical protein [Flavobacteriales bacterium]
MINFIKITLRYYYKFGLTGILLSIKLLFIKNNLFVPNIKYPISLRKDTSDLATFHQMFNKEEYNINLDFIPKNIIDLGANIGLGAIYFSNRYPAAHIFCVEIEQSNYKLLKRNISFYENISSTMKAIYNINNQKVNIVDKGYGEWGYMIESEKKLKENMNLKGSISTITIDEIMKILNVKKIDILKIDIEGAEHELFKNNYDTWLPNTRCLIIELHDRMRNRSSQNFFKAISKYDFSYSHQGENLVFINNKKL